MLKTNDKIVLVNEMGMFTNVGEVCNVVKVEDNGTIWFSFGGGLHMGCMSEDEFEKYFEVYEAPERMTFDDAMEFIEHCDVMVDTVFDRCTVMCCQLPNGFVIVENSACIDKDIYSEEVGIRICKEKVAAKILELNAYNTLEQEYDGCCNDDYDINPYDDQYDVDDPDCDEEDCEDCGFCAENVSVMSGHSLGWRW